MSAPVNVIVISVQAVTVPSAVIVVVPVTFKRFPVAVARLVVVAEAISAHCAH